MVPQLLEELTFKLRPTSKAYTQTKALVIGNGARGGHGGAPSSLPLREATTGAQLMGQLLSLCMHSGLPLRPWFPGAEPGGG